jgi:hypothetical protein
VVQAGACGASGIIGRACAGVGTARNPAAVIAVAAAMVALATDLAENNFCREVGTWLVVMNVLLG